MDTICEACRAIDFEKALQISAEQLRSIRDPFNKLTFTEPWILLEENTTRFENAETASCPLCYSLYLSLCPCEDEWSEPETRDAAALSPFDLQALSFNENCLWAQGDVDPANDCQILLATRGMTSSNGNYAYHVKRESGYVVCLPKERRERPFIPREIPDHFDVRKARSWLRSCKKDHGPLCNQDVGMIPGMKVIDCDTLTVVEAEPEMIWVALSYVWGRPVWGHPKPDRHSADPESIPLAQRMSKTVKDAVKVTKSLGYKYLWVDRFCIDQGNWRHKQSQIGQMDAIYRGADLTIIAAAGEDENHGLPGVGDTGRKKQHIVELDSCTILSTGPDPAVEAQQSCWSSRGWTFQEDLLSRRRLFFTDHQSWFECGNACWMEGLGGPELCDSLDEIHATAGAKVLVRSRLSSYHDIHIDHVEGRDSADAQTLGLFFQLAHQYSQRKLTFHSDILNAFEGVSRYLRNNGPQLSHFLGIPYIPSLLGLEAAEKYWVFSLCWFHSSEVTLRMNPSLSWSWSGWTGEVQWMTNRPEGSLQIIPKIRNIQTKNNGETVPWDAFLRSWSPNKSKVNDPALYFEARVVPSYMFIQYSPELHGGGAWESGAYNADDGQSDQPADMVDGQDDGNTTAHSVDLSEHGEEGLGKPEVDDVDDLFDNTAFTPHLSDGRDSDSVTSELDPQDWKNWRVGKHQLLEHSQPPCTPLEFIKNLDDNGWTCLLLADYDGNAGYTHRRFLLVVRWRDDGTAYRVGALVLNQHYYVDEDAKDFFDESDLSWRSVCLV
ncbi:hypothetical protein PFICI_03877 [Pestalotiopsis fici W106-1]|uniref:Heterokaryon incompatibility domain-containing protein n=1 Tax=Pestalotiopsis fici (strain W106-1 / CGMCC3.15140) TaxID=1229662 RepID=W3XK62_PESFW|nr:uncharacterized protein PFICI_03877 [Pestalotiopsis fici W106-1]ETS85852.1 hypothetical protein PFICI_03877 [Pestalotiopsis fici W106-1]